MQVSVDRFGILEEMAEPFFFEPNEIKSGFDPERIFAHLLRQRFGHSESQRILNALKKKFTDVQQIIRSSRSQLATITPKGGEVFDELSRLRKLATLF